MSAQNILRYQISGAAPLWVGKINPYEYHSWMRFINDIRVWKDLVCNETDNLGATAASWAEQTKSWNVIKTADKVGWPILTGDLSLLTVVAGTFRRYVDMIGFNIIKEVVITNSSNDCMKITNEDMIFWYRTLEREERDVVADLVAADKSTAQRNALGAAAQALKIPLGPLFFFKDPAKYLSVMQLALEPRITITFRKFADLVQSDDAATTAKFENLKLRMEYCHYEAPLRDQLSKIVMTKTGLVERFDDVVRVKQNFTTATTIDVDLSVIRGDVKGFWFYVRESDGTKADLTLNNWTNFIAIQDWKLTAGSGEDLVPGNGLVISNQFNKELWRKYFPRVPAGDNIYIWFFSHQPSNKNDTCGFLGFNNVNKPILTIRLTGAIGGTGGDVYFNAIYYNMIQHLNGDLSKAIPSN